MKLFPFLIGFGSISAISLLQLATRAGIPRQSEIQGDFLVASSSLHSLLTLATRILSTVLPNEASPIKIESTRYLLIRKRRHHIHERWLDTSRCQWELAQSLLRRTFQVAVSALDQTLQGKLIVELLFQHESP
jgi:hypothetical protein